MELIFTTRTPQGYSTRYAMMIIQYINPTRLMTQAINYAVTDNIIEITVLVDRKHLVIVAIGRC